jgi:hypothetical protein
MAPTNQPSPEGAIQPARCNPPRAFATAAPRHSIPHIPFIEGDAVPFQELSVFLLKRFLAVVLSLVGDVFANGFDVRFGNSESPITGLPAETDEPRSLRLDPFGRSLLDLLNGLTDRHRPGKIEEDVSVVIHGIDEHGSGPEVLQHGGHIGVEGIAHGIGDDGFAILGAEDQMNMKAGEGLGHRLGRPFRARVCFLNFNPGRCPGLAWVAPLALGTVLR